MSRSPDVVVVGGGIVGISVAASCARRGLTVTLCEAAGLAQAASGRNQGLVIGPNPPAMEAIGHRTLQLLLDLHERSGGAFAFDREPYGCLMLGGESDDMLTGEALCELEPQLAPGVGPGWINHNARRIDPGTAAAVLADDARAAGAEIRTGCAVRELLRNGGDVTGVLTDDGRIEAACVVVAAGPWSWRVCRSLAHDVPVRGVRGWIIVTRPAPFRLQHVIEEYARTAPAAPTLGQLAEGSEPAAHIPCVLQQDAAGRVLVGASLHGATMEGDEAPETRRAIARRAVEVVPALAGVAIADSRSCQRPYSPDGLPLIGPYPGVRGLVLATGHGSLGVTQSLGSGEAVADGLVEGRWEAALDPARLLA
ncbi:MAG TPA: FAD-dependent oxidoreductase [Gaiellales bacterium]|nr:FAD-dependent oxidoreductase [Gaiellales bacterium]